MAQTPPPAADTTIAAAAADTEIKAQSSPAWTATYDGLAAKLPAAVSSRLPSSAAAATAVATAQDQLATLSKSSKQRFTEMSRTASHKAGQMSQASKDQWLAKAWSVTNETQIPLNVALCQVCVAALLLSLSHADVLLMLDLYLQRTALLRGACARGHLRASRPCVLALLALLSPREDDRS